MKTDCHSGAKFAQLYPTPLGVYGVYKMESPMISAYQSGLSALQAFGTKIQSNSNNIANANTEGFKKTRVTLAETAPQGVKANVELSSEIPEMNLNSRFYQANLKTIETVNDMTGTLLDLKS
jgi:flagellar basal-body rod protein FlgC